VTLQNRVDPYGSLHAVAARGAWMGNRGVLHDESRRIVATWRLRRWIACELSFRGRRREVFAPGRYTELFFLDEATALAAGHRPCAECRRSRYEEFRAAWAAGAGRPDRVPAANALDAALHADRVDSRGEKKTFEARLGSLPPGTLVERGGRPHLVVDRARTREWTFSGYGPARRGAPETRVAVLTPRSIVSAIRAGYAPQRHESAGA